MTRFLRLAVSAAAIALLSAVPVAAITNGTPDSGGHPFVGWAYGETPDGNQTVGCSGVLVAENVLLTSAVCSSALEAALVPGGNLQNVWVTFDPDEPVPVPFGDFDPPITPPSVRVSEFHTNPAWVDNSGMGKDVANVGVLILESPVPGPYADLPVANRLDGITGDEIFTAVAYGTIRNETIVTLMRRFGEAAFMGLGPDAIFLRLVEHGPEPACVGGQNEAGGAFLGTSEVVAIVIDETTGCTRIGHFQRLDVGNVRSFLDDFVTLP